MRKRNVSWGWMLFVICAAAHAEEPVDYEIVAKIRAEAFNESQVMDTVFHLTDVFGPRLAGSPGYDAAAHWAAERMAEWGMAETRVEPWGEFGRGWTLEKFSIEMIEPYYSPLIGYPKAWTGPTAGLVESEPVIFTPEDREAMDEFKGKVEGKILLTRPPLEIEKSFEPEATRRPDEDLAARARSTGMAQPPRKVEGQSGGRSGRRRSFSSTFFLREEKPALLLEPSRGGYGTLFVAGGGSNKVGANPPTASVVLIAEHYNRIYRLIEAGVNVRLRAEVGVKFHEDDPSDYNVFAEIPGTDPEIGAEVVMLGAHLDSWHAATGATDNAAGCAVVMEAARILLALDVEPRRTIRIGLWGAEERGLRGSRAYATSTFGKPSNETRPEAFDDFSSYFNFDNGTGKIRGVYSQGNRAVRPIFEAWLAPFADLDATTVTIDGVGGTDHQSFDRVGLPGFQFIQDPMDYFTRTHHTNMDWIEHVIEADLMQSAAIMAAFAYHAAMRDEKIPRKPVAE